jgi:hypothetical protein
VRGCCRFHVSKECVIRGHIFESRHLRAEQTPAPRQHDHLTLLTAGNICSGPEVGPVTGRQARFGHSLPAWIAIDHSTPGEPLDVYPERTVGGYVLERLLTGWNGIGNTKSQRDNLRDLSAGNVSVGPKVGRIVGRIARLSRPTARITCYNPQVGQILYIAVEPISGANVGIRLAQALGCGCGHGCVG